MPADTGQTRKTIRREKLTRGVVFWVSPSTYAAYRNSALEADQGLADWIRLNLPVETPPTRRPSPGTARHRVRIHADPELLCQLAALGNNLNQMARAINGGALAKASSIQQTRWLLHLGRMEMHLSDLQGQQAANYLLKSRDHRGEPPGRKSGS